MRSIHIFDGRTGKRSSVRDYPPVKGQAVEWAKAWRLIDDTNEWEEVGFDEYGTNLVNEDGEVVYLEW